MKRRAIALGAASGSVLLILVGLALVRQQDYKPNEDLELLLRYGRASTRFDEGDHIRYQVEFERKTPMLDRELQSTLVARGWTTYTPPSKSWVLSRPHWTGSYATIIHAPDGRSMVLSQYSTGDGYAILTVDAPWPHRLLAWAKRVLHVG